MKMSLFIKNLFCYLKGVKKIQILNYVRKHHLSIIGLLLAVILVPWGVQLSQEAEAEKSKNILTETIKYHFTATLKVELAKVKDDAKCQTSNASHRRDAYRCIFENEIHDPCFYAAEGGYVDCPLKPEDHQVITVALIDKNVSESRQEKQFPWYLKLEDGTECRYYTGGSYELGGSRVDYGCNNKIVLSLPLDDKDSVHRINCYNPQLERIRACKIKEAWY